MSTPPPRALVQKSHAYFIELRVTSMHSSSKAASSEEALYIPGRLFRTLPTSRAVLAVSNTSNKYRVLYDNLSTSSCSSTPVVCITLSWSEHRLTAGATGKPGLPATYFLSAETGMPCAYNDQRPASTSASIIIDTIGTNHQPSQSQVRMRVSPTH